MDLFVFRKKPVTKTGKLKETQQPGKKCCGFKKKVITGILTICCLFMTFHVFGQRHMEYLTRGLVAVKTTDYVFLSWRMLTTDNDSVRFNLYRNNTLLNISPIKGISNYVDSAGTVNSIYYLETIYDLATKEISTPVTVWQQPYKSIHLQSPGAGYYPNDASVGDLDGDGEMEIIVKMQTSNPDNTGGEICDPVFLHAYKLNGTLLWSINLGVNIRAGSHYTQLMVYDLNDDGIAEVACKTAPGTMDGTGKYLSMGPAASDDDAADYRDASGLIVTGPEYLTVFNGLTGEEMSTVEYIPVRGDQISWGDTWGNRVDRFLACVAYFDSIPSLVMCRGYYTGSGRGRTVLAAWDLKNDSLKSRWVFNADLVGENPTYTGQGNHNLSVADVDNDGKDEIIYGSMAIDDDGTGLWNSRLGHGDALHVGDIDPDRPGLEVWGIHENAQIGSALLDAATGEIIWNTGAGDVARGVAADIDSSAFGMECWGGTDGLRSCKNEPVGDWPSSSNFVIWWDSDLLRELLDGVTISKYNNGSDIQIFTASGCMSNNGTKSTPTISGDILGDWREEVIFKTLDDQELRIYTTTAPTKYGIYTLLQDPQYRLALVWQNVGYNQPPHPGFYLGHGMNMDSLPVPDIKVHQADHPSIHITSPDDGFELGLGLDLDVIVHPVAISDTNKMVIISMGNTPLDTIYSAPYYTSIPGLTTGDYSFVAGAYDIEGNWMKSDTISITVDEGFPHISITSPIEGNTYLPEDSITVTALAFDTDGNIDSVAIYLNNNRLTTFTLPPYSIKIENPGVGIHELKAIAYDNDGKITESKSINLEVGVVNTIQETDIGFCGFKNGTGWIESNNVGYTGTGFANSDNVLGVQINWAVDFPEAGMYKFVWRYASSSARPGNLLLNDNTIVDVPFISTVDFTTWEIISVNANASAGITKVGLEATGGSGLPNIDYLKIYSLESNEEINGVICDSIYSSDSTLSDLSVTGQVLNPAFHKDTLNYTLSLAPGTRSVNINATPTNANATVSGTGSSAVSSPSGSKDVIVTAENGISTLTYTINYVLPTSVRESVAGELQIFPNPAQHYLIIQLSDISETFEYIRIFTVDGREILATGKVNTSQTRLELPEMQNGIYLMHVRTNLKSYCIKLNVNR